MKEQPFHTSYTLLLCEGELMSNIDYRWILKISFVQLFGDDSDDDFHRTNVNSVLKIPIRLMVQLKVSN